MFLQELEKHKKIISPLQNYENHGIRIIQSKNHENHGNLIIHFRIKKLIKFLEFYTRFMIIIKNLIIPPQNHEDHEIPKM